MNLANKLTLSRAILGIIIAILIYFQNFYAYLAATILFVFSVWTDHYDGILARKIKKVTTFGKFIDPISDKILIIATLSALAEIGLIPVWVVFVVFIREIMMMGLRSLAAAEGKILGANNFGKSKGVVQYSAISAALALLTLNEYGISVPKVEQIVYGLVLVTTAVIVLTALIVFHKNRKFFGNS